MIEVHDASMSDAAANAFHMSSLLQEDAEGWSRLKGLMAMLALPGVRNPESNTLQNRVVQIEIRRDVWTAIDAVAIEAERVIFWVGTNGSRQEFVFRRSEGVPQWRMYR